MIAPIRPGVPIGFSRVPKSTLTKLNCHSLTGREQFLLKPGLEIGGQLAAIAELKVNQLVQYRKERLGDANTFYPIFPKQTSQAGVSGIQ